MKSYYTGTTLECFQQILRDGFIKKRPPHRVWPTYSEDYVYLIPSQHKYEDSETLLSFAFEQADFAIYQLNGTKRVILEIEGLDEDLLEDDPDAESIYAVRYPRDIPVSYIKNIYIDKEDCSKNINEFIAITMLFRDENRHYLNDIYYWYLEADNPNYIYEKINIKHINLIPVEILIDENELERRYHDYHETLDYFPNYEKYSLDEFLETISSLAS